MGRDDRRRPALPDRPLVGRGDARASRSSSSASASTCSATGCATCSTRRPRDEPRRRSSRSRTCMCAFHLRRGTVEAVRGVSFSLGSRTARHRRGIRLGKVADRPRNPRPDAAARRGHGEAARLRRDRSPSRLPARASPPARQPHDHGDAGPEILARSGDDRSGKQIVEAYRAHTKASKAEAREKALAMLEAVRIHNPQPRPVALSARAFRRHGPARDDRHDARHRPRPADRRRADLGARRDGAARSAAHPRRPRRASAAWG